MRGTITIIKISRWGKKVCKIYLCVDTIFIPLPMQTFVHVFLFRYEDFFLDTTWVGYKSYCFLLLKLSRTHTQVYSSLYLAFPYFWLFTFTDEITCQPINFITLIKNMTKHVQLIEILLWNWENILVGFCLSFLGLSDSFSGQTIFLLIFSSFIEKW